MCVFRQSGNLEFLWQKKKTVRNSLSASAKCEYIKVYTNLPTLSPDIASFRRQKQEQRARGDRRREVGREVKRRTTSFSDMDPRLHAHWGFGGTPREEEVVSMSKINFTNKS